MTSELPPPPPPGPLPPPAPWATPAAPTRGWDGLSIASFVCALICCAAPVAVGLGIAGLVRTRQGRRRGRWMAIVGLVLGSLLTLTMIGGVVAIGISTLDDVDAAAVHPGTCIDLDFLDTPSTASCDGPHDGEVIWSGQITDALKAEWDDSEYIDDFCFNRDIAAEYVEAYQRPSITIDYWTDDFGGGVKTGTWMACYLTDSDGELHAPIADLIHAGAAT